jgi:hypothetical protein
MASQFFSTTSFTINVNLTDGNAHTVALYLLAWDSTERAETITISSATAARFSARRTFPAFTPASGPSTPSLAM